MTKALNILTASILLLATTAGNLSVFQCLIDGSFCLTKLCYPDNQETLKEKSCCDHNSEIQQVVEEDVFLIKGNCCVEIDVERDFLNDIEMNIGVSESIIVSESMSSPSLSPVFLSSARCTVINDPPPSIFLKKTYNHLIYKKLCTFLC
jgi:hypothetical protein